MKDSEIMSLSLFLADSLTVGINTVHVIFWTHLCFVCCHRQFQLVAILICRVLNAFKELLRDPFDLRIHVLHMAAHGWVIHMQKGAQLISQLWPLEKIAFSLSV